MTKYEWIKDELDAEDVHLNYKQIHDIIFMDHSISPEIDELVFEIYEESKNWPGLI